MIEPGLLDLFEAPFPREWKPKPGDRAYVLISGYIVSDAVITMSGEESHWSGNIERFFLFDSYDLGVKGMRCGINSIRPRQREQ